MERNTNEANTMKYDDELFKEFQSACAQIRMNCVALKAQQRQVCFDSRSTRLLQLGMALGTGRPSAIKNQVKKFLRDTPDDDLLRQLIDICAVELGTPAAFDLFVELRNNKAI